MKVKFEWMKQLEVSLNQSINIMFLFCRLTMACEPRLLNLWEKVVIRMINDNTLSLDQFQLHKIMPAIKELLSQSGSLTAGDLIEYFKTVEPKVQKLFWAYDYIIPEKYAPPIKFDYLCWYMKHCFYKSVIRHLYRASKKEVNDMILIIMITDSCLAFDSEFFETIVHKFSMFIIQEVLFMFCPNVIPNHITTKTKSKEDKNYHDKMLKLSNGGKITIDILIEYFCSMRIEIDEIQLNKSPNYLEYLKPPGYDFMINNIRSVSEYCQILNALYNKPGFAYDEIVKMVLISVSKTASHGYMEPGIIQAFAEFICLQMME